MAKFALRGGYMGHGLSIVLCLVCPLAGRAELIYRNPRPYDVTYTFELEPDPAKIDRAKDLKVWLPLPREWESQKAVRILSITPKPDATWEDPEFGNRMAFWDFGRGPEKRIYQAQVRFRLEAFNVQADMDPAKVGAYDTNSAEYRLYTRNERTIHITPKIKELAREAVGEETNPYLQTQRIERFVENKINFKINDYERGRGIDVLLAYPVTDPKTGQECYEGCCNQISALQVALCRAVGIPARCVSGFVGWSPWVPPGARYSFETNLLSGRLAGAQYSGQSNPHMWTEYLIPNYGWVPDGSMVGRYNLKVVKSVGRDIKIGPNCPQEGSQGYGMHWVLLENGRADELGPVWNIAKIRTARVNFVVEPEPFPAEEFAHYVDESLPWPVTNAESRIKVFRTSTLRSVCHAAAGQRDSGAALAADFKGNNHKYKCGVFVLEMLRHQVGDEAFSRIYQDYVDLRVRSQAPVPTQKFQALAEKITGQPLDWFFRQWATLTNLPVLRLDRVTATRLGAGWSIRGYLLQEGSTLFRLPLPLLLRTEQGAERKEIWLKKRKAQFEFRTANRPKRLLVDPDFEVLKIQKTAPHLTEFWYAKPNLLLVYGTQAEAAVNKNAAERFAKEYAELDATKIKADSEVTEEDLKAPCLCLFGRPKTNKIAERFKDDFPIQVGDDQFVWQGTTYRQPTQGVVQAIEPPGRSNQLVLLFAGLGAEAMKAIGDNYLYDLDVSYVIFDGDKQLLSDDWEGADPNLRWEFASEVLQPKH